MVGPAWLTKRYELSNADSRSWAVRRRRASGSCQPQWRQKAPAGRRSCWRRRSGARVSGCRAADCNPNPNPNPDPDPNPNFDPNLNPNPKRKRMRFSFRCWLNHCSFCSGF